MKRPPTRSSSIHTSNKVTATPQVTGNTKITKVAAAALDNTTEALSNSMMLPAHKSTSTSRTPRFGRTTTHRSTTTEGKRHPFDRPNAIYQSVARQRFFDLIWRQIFFCFLILLLNFLRPLSVFRWSGVVVHRGRGRREDQDFHALLSIHTYVSFNNPIQHEITKDRNEEMMKLKKTREIIKKKKK